MYTYSTATAHVHVHVVVMSFCLLDGEMSALVEGNIIPARKLPVGTSGTKGALDRHATHVQPTKWLVW